jgi:hypothetical protein
MGCYGSSGNSLSASLALKTLVKELHRNEIEVAAFLVWLTGLQMCVVLRINYLRKSCLTSWVKYTLFQEIQGNHNFESNVVGFYCVMWHNKSCVYLSVHGHGF